MKHTKLAIIILTTILLFAAFMGSVNYEINNPFIAYLYYVANLAVRFLPIIVILISIIVGLLIWKYYSKKHDSRQTIHTLIHLFGVVLISVFSAFMILVIIALIQLNSFSIIINSNPSNLGVKTEIKDILLTLKENDESPKIISSENDSREAVKAVARAASGENLYGSAILNGIPKILIYPIRNDIPNMMLMDNTLVITNVEIDEIEAISPVISNLFLQKYFPLRNIRAYPKVSVMSDEDYVKFREDDVKEKIKNINTQTDKMNELVASTSSSITSIEEQIENIDFEKESVLEDRNKQFNDCLNDGEYIDGKFVRNNTKRDCEALVETAEDEFIEDETLEKDLKEQLVLAQKKLGEYEYLSTFFEAQQKLTDLSASNVPSERGIFIPEDEIQIVLLSNESNSIVNYFASLVHEYLHYASFTEGKRLESAFFEEGLSEYFARGAIKDSMQIDTNIGYPLTVAIIEQMLTRLPEEDMADIYFTKDQQKLEDTLDLVYGDDFYVNNIVQFETLLYTGDNDEAIKIANEIIEKIDGIELTPEDVYSS